MEERVTNFTPAAKSQPLWRTVLSILSQRIQDGIYPIGVAMPREVDIAKELNVSRNTVRTAMEALSQQGAVARKKRLGTVVLSDSTEGRIRFNIDPLASLERLNAGTHLRLIDKELREFPQELKNAYPDAYGHRWITLTLVRVHNFDGRALSYVVVYLLPKFHAIAENIDREHGTVFKLIERLAGETFGRAETVVTPTKLSKRTAEILGVKFGELALKVSHRLFSNNGELLEVAEGIYPSSRYQIELAFDLAARD